MKRVENSMRAGIDMPADDRAEDEPDEQVDAGPQATADHVEEGEPPQAVRLDRGDEPDERDGDERDARERHDRELRARGHRRMANGDARFGDLCHARHLCIRRSGRCQVPSDRYAALLVAERLGELAPARGRECGRDVVVVAVHDDAADLRLAHRAGADDAARDRRTGTPGLRPRARRHTPRRRAGRSARSGSCSAPSQRDPTRCTQGCRRARAACLGGRRPVERAVAGP